MTRIQPAPRAAAARLSFRPLLRFFPFIAIFFIFLAAGVSDAGAETMEKSAASDQWKSDFAVLKSFDIEIDTEGYVFPTAIAFVPHPGPAPDSPLYYVTELTGSIKVVTNDRRVAEFSKVPAFDTGYDPNAMQSEAGLAGICLDPAHGYIFVTFTANDSNRLLRNHIIRYESKPETFSPVPLGRMEIAPVLAKDLSSFSHQIGGCRVEGDILYVGLGDGGRPENSRNIDHLLGKVVRMTLDGKPVPGNPFLQPGGADPDASRNYVWAYGLRNPFGIEIADGRVFVVDNGLNQDRFLKIDPGVDYLWDGTAWSIMAAADAVFSPAAGPVHLQRYPDGSPVFPESFRNDFFFSGSSKRGGGIVAVPYDFSSEKVRLPPFYLLKATRKGEPGVVGLAFGPDGLYFSPIMPVHAGRTPVFKLVYNPESRYPTLIGGGPVEHLIKDRCLGCHLWQGAGGLVGPSLTREALVPDVTKRLHSESYRQKLAEIDKIREEPFISTRKARRAVLEAAEENRVDIYLLNKIMEPKFDNPNTPMPKFGFTRDEAAKIVNLLLHRTDAPWSHNVFIGTAKRIRNGLPFPAGRRGDAAFGAVAGFILGIFFFVAAWVIKRAMRRKP